MKTNRPLLVALAAAPLLALALVALAFGAFAQSGRHGDGHAEMHDIYKYWHPPLNPGTSCCDNADCRPTRAFVDGEGHWRGWDGGAWLGGGPGGGPPSDH